MSKKKMIKMFYDLFLIKNEEGDIVSDLYNIQVIKYKNKIDMHGDTLINRIQNIINRK